MDDLFSSRGSFEKIRLAGADVSYLRDFRPSVDKLELLKELIRETPWRQEDVVVWGKAYQQPRLIAWYGDPGKAYSYSGVALDPLPWTDRIYGLKHEIEMKVDFKFNSVLLNYYRDENDSMGLHSDDERELGPAPVIASLSLGAERTFIFKSKINPDEKPFRIRLSSGSLLLMKGDTQRNYKHGIAKENRPTKPRVNLTFRQIIR
jgi:alkylated DNA repair dioxygenase AlkB